MNGPQNYEQLLLPLAQPVVVQNYSPASWLSPDERMDPRFKSSAICDVDLRTGRDEFLSNLPAGWEWRSPRELLTVFLDAETLADALNAAMRDLLQPTEIDLEYWIKARPSLVLQAQTYGPARVEVDYWKSVLNDALAACVMRAYACATTDRA